MAETAHRRFLELLGWQGAELEAFLPEWMNAAEFLRLSDADVDFAVDEWLPQYWDMSLEGTRKCIAAVIREAVGGLPLNEPEIVEWIGQYVAEGIGGVERSRAER